ncbi:MAG: sodium-dependent transporter [Simkaniaceae bacterium]|nr:sodium-dependent transporter [Simkaniaceae bacterium]
MRGKWGSSLGFILASSGAAVGLGNIQRFPYITAEHGGAAFILLYLACVVLLALPLMLVEFAIGRHTQRNPVCAIEKIKPNSPWKWVGVLGIFTAFFILSYYSVMGGWTISYIFDAKTPSSLNTITYMALFLTLCAAIVSQGVHKGIERASKILMPLLLLILVILVVHSLMLEGSEVGLAYYLKPDFSELDAKAFLYALSQAFFSLCIGEAVLVTYGSYASKGENLLASAGYIALFDTVVAILAGLMIFPALFAFNVAPTSGITLTFEVLPKLFAVIPYGAVFNVLFFVLLGFAALTTGIALLEIPVIYLIDARGWKRMKATFSVVVCAFIVGLPSGLSMTFYAMMDFIWGGLAMIIGGGLLAIFTGWVWGAKNAAKELEHGAPRFASISKIWGVLIKFVAPLLIGAILLSFFF